MELLSESEIVVVFERFKKQNKNPRSELHWKNAYTLLVAVVLSAQATDKSVNKATEPLFAVVDTPEKMLALGEASLIDYIRSIGLYRAKAAHIMGLSKMLIDEFGGVVPSNRADLERLPGVGRKTANVVLNVVFNQSTMPVDTHLLRICPKIGLAAGTTPLEVETGLVARIPQQYMLYAHHWLILHGRYVCTARNPHCDDCIISDVCKHNDVVRAADRKLQHTRHR
ncbi:MAG: endonuclease III [Treponema sp.]|nr:endonuclease III [Treponema sp.]